MTAASGRVGLMRVELGYGRRRLAAHDWRDESYACAEGRRVCWAGPGPACRRRSGAGMGRRRRPPREVEREEGRAAARQHCDPQPGFCPSHCGGSCGRGLPRAATYGRHPCRNHQALPGQPASRSRLSVAGQEFESRLLIQTLLSRTIDPRSRPVVRTWVTADVLGEEPWGTCSSL